VNEPRSHYDPSLFFPYGEPFYPPSSWQTSPYVISGPAPASHGGGDFWGALQDFGHAVEHSVQQIPTLGHEIGHAFDQPASISQKADQALAKANHASDTVTQQANQVSDDARSAIADAKEAAKVVKYVAFGIGGLAAVALVFHIIKTATD
jgi:hypothetical protein